MTVGMAGVAGTILGAYAGMIGPHLLPYLLAASFMSAPGGILMAKIMMPDDPKDIGIEPIVMPEASHDEEKPANIIMAAAQERADRRQAGGRGRRDGDGVRRARRARQRHPRRHRRLVRRRRPVVPGDYRRDLPPGDVADGRAIEESATVGGLFGSKVVLNEFVAFIDLGRAQGDMSMAAVAIATFALCGFANFSSIAIQMAVTGGLAPNQRPMIAKLGLKALLAGSLSNLMSAALAGLMLGIAPPLAAPPPQPATPVGGGGAHGCHDQRSGEGSLTCRYGTREPAPAIWENLQAVPE